MYDQETHYFVMQARISAHFKDSIVIGFLLSTLCLICFIVFVGKNVTALTKEACRNLQKENHETKNDW